MKKVHLLRKKKDENAVTYGEKARFFFSDFDKISRSKIKIPTFFGFFDPKFELYGSKFDTKNDQKNHI